MWHAQRQVGNHSAGSTSFGGFDEESSGLAAKEGVRIAYAGQAKYMYTQKFNGYL